MYFGENPLNMPPAFADFSLVLLLDIEDADDKCFETSASQWITWDDYNPQEHTLHNYKSIYQLFSELLEFWTLSIVGYSTQKKTQHFENWVCFRSQVKGGE
jgi:hypothetical protein